MSVMLYDVRFRRLLTVVPVNRSIPQGGKRKNSMLRDIHLEYKSFYLKKYLRGYKKK